MSPQPPKLDFSANCYFGRLITVLDDYEEERMGEKKTAAMAAKSSGQ